MNPGMPVGGHGPPTVELLRHDTLNTGEDEVGEFLGQPGEKARLQEFTTDTREMVPYA